MDPIRKYLMEETEATEVVAGLLEKKVSKYDDIKAEFLRWLEQRNYQTENPVEVNGYTAEKIHELAPMLDGVGVYNFMVTLRDEPEFAAEIIKEGFPVR